MENSDLNLMNETLEHLKRAQKSLGKTKPSIEKDFKVKLINALIDVATDSLDERINEIKDYDKEG